MRKSLNLSSNLENNKCKMVEFNPKKVKVEKTKELRQVKILLAGEGGVGKSAIAQRFANNIFSEDYQPTIGSDFFTIPLKLESTIELRVYIYIYI